MNALVTDMMPDNIITSDGSIARSGGGVVRAGGSSSQTAAKSASLPSARVSRRRSDLVATSATNANTSSSRSSSKLAASLDSTAGKAKTSQFNDDSTSSMGPNRPWWAGPATPPSALTACSANPRQAITDFTGLPNNTAWLVSYWADLTPNTTCRYKPGSFARTACTASQLAPYLVLTASHCVDPYSKRTSTDPDYAGCQKIVLYHALLCYAFKRDTFECKNGVEAFGVSYWPRTATTDPFDQAIVFVKTARPGPYYQVTDRGCL